MEALLNAGFADSGLVLGVKEAQPSIDLLTSVLDELAFGLMVVTQNGHVIHANQAARSELARNGLLQSSGELGIALTPEQGKAMQEALDSAAAGSDGLVTLSSDCARLTLAVVALKPEPGLPVRLALVFSRAAFHEPVMLGLFARIHGLTATEEQVLGILCQGHSAPDVALRMKLAVSTIRTHVRSMCAKTHSFSVRELVKRVAVLPPVASASTAAPKHNQVH